MAVIKGITLEPRLLGVPIAAGRRANGFELGAAASWADVVALKGEVLPGVGEIVEVGAPRLDPLPAGTRINLVTVE